VVNQENQAFQTIKKSSHRFLSLARYLYYPLAGENNTKEESATSQEKTLLQSE